VSVVIPSYNGADYIHRAIESSLNQTFPPHEIIVIDDASTDGTAAVAESFGSPVHVIRLAKNSGVAYARNRGVEACSGEWVAFLDADDIWEADKLERQVAAIRPRTVLSFTGISTFDGEGTRGDRAVAAPEAVKKMLRYCNPITTSTVLARTDALRRSGGFREDVRACEDWELWVLLLSLGEFELVGRSLTRYFIRPQSLSASPERMLRALDQIIERTLLDGLNGFDRWAWRRRIRSVQLCSAGLIARENGLSGELRYMIRSLCAWPSPFWEPERFVTLMVSAKNKFRSKTLATQF
jgi:glycosyltransferase involved in cell wall biosynthesis